MNSMVTVDASQIKQASKALKSGELIGLPTETVYGLAADAACDDAVARIFAAKNRPDFNPLIVHVRSVEHAAELVEVPGLARKLASAFWPGPLTLVLPRRTDCPISLLASAGLDTLAVRCPDHPVAQAVLQDSGLALAAPSANPSGRISPTRAEHVAEGLGDKVALILDGGPCIHGVESTIVKVDEDRLTLLRPGSITEAQLATFAPVLSAASDAPVSAPGQLKSHYAPSAAIRLNVANVADNEALLSFGPAPKHPAPLTFPLSDKADLVEAAANLFAQMRAADKSGASSIAVMPIPLEGLGLAINDRLARAAAPRPTEGPHD